LDLVDLHSHLLPGIDDGPRDLGETIATLRAAHAAGTRRMATTPHMFLEPWNHHDPAPIRDAHSALVDALRERADEDPDCAFLREMRIDLGAENYASPEFLAALERGDVLSLNAGRYVLIEFPPMLPSGTVWNVARRVLSAGRFPVLAHIERYTSLHGRPSELAGLRDLGCVLQVNAQSLAGRTRDPTRRLCIELLRSGIVEVVASDAHGTTLGRPHLGTVEPALRGEVPADTLELCLRAKPRRILDDAALNASG
jgi:protein-tyrosine phosphatase